MPEPKHTPGPWSFVIHDSDADEILVTDDETGSVVAVVYPHGEVGDTEIMVANAEVISRAPEVLEHIESLEAERDRYRDLADRLKLEAQIHAGEARTQTATVHECYQAASGATGERGDWHGANPVREKIASLEAERDELRHEVTTLNEMGADLTRERDELRATVERYREALDTELARYDTEDFGDAEEEAYCHGAVQALTNLRARFQPTGGD